VEFETALNKVSFLSSSPNFQKFTFNEPDLIQNQRAIKGGMGIVLEHGNAISAVVPLG